MTHHSLTTSWGPGTAFEDFGAYQKAIGLRI